MTKIATGGPKTVFPRGRRDPSEEGVERESVAGVAVVPKPDRQ
ncbi:hypothetical protein [Natronococcus sp. JC468]|nr:hypothetical protein [Natronococcus sp. JC468]